MTQQLTPHELELLQELGLDINSSSFIDNVQSLLAGIQTEPNELFTSIQENFIPTKPLEFSPQAQAVFEAGRELWKYYFEKITGIQIENVSKNPSLYDIKAYFQGVNDKGRMNNSSKDEKYNELIANLRESLEILSLKIQPKVYEFGFLK